jgi:Ca-activated chloride channel family protein
MRDTSGQPIRSKLNEPELQALADAGQGIYRRADYRDADTREVLAAAAISSLPPEAGDERTRVWNDRYYLPLLLIAALLLPQFRDHFRLRRLRSK